MNESLLPSDDELLDMAFGADPEAVPGGWEALVDSGPELRLRFEEAARRVRLIRMSRALLDLAPACVTVLLTLRRARRSTASLQISLLDPAEAVLGPDGPAAAGDLQVSLGAVELERIVELELGARVYLRMAGADASDLDVIGIDRSGSEHRLRLRSEGDFVVSETWRLAKGEAPVVLGCRAREGGENRVVGWVVLIERAGVVGTQEVDS